MNTILELLFDVSIRATVIALGVGCVLMAMRVKSPAVAHRAWTGVLLIMLFLPVLYLWAPRVPIPVLPSLSIRQEIPNHPPVLPVSSSSERIAAGDGSGIKLYSASESPMPVPLKKQSVMFQTVLIVYFLGLCFFAVRLLTGMLLSHRLGRNAQWNARGFYYSVCTVPLTIGLFRTRILLPEDAKHWNPEKLEAVLDHESEHVRRHDSLVAWLALLNRCIFWFHPIAWWLCARLTALAEQACDEEVLARGHDSGNYAEYLLEFARSVREKRTLAPLGSASFHGSSLAQRIRRIVIPARTPPISRARMVGVAALCVIAALAPAVGEPMRTHPSSPRLIPAFPTVPGSLIQPNQAHTQAVSISRPDQTDEPLRTLNPGVESGQSRPINADSSNSRDEGLYKTGLKLLEKHQYKEARQVFENLINAFPDSRFAAPSRLAIADSFYNEGGAENLGEALYHYHRFLIRFPDNPRADDVELKIIALNARMMNSSGMNPGQFYANRALLELGMLVEALTDRNSYARFRSMEAINAYDPFTAEAVINRYLQKYPDSDLVPTAKQAFLDVRENLADGHFRVAEFYFKSGNYAGASSRLKTIIDRYPDFSRIDEVRHLYERLPPAVQP